MYYSEKEILEKAGTDKGFAYNLDKIDKECFTELVLYKLPLIDTVDYSYFVEYIGADNITKDLALRLAKTKYAEDELRNSKWLKDRDIAKVMVEHGKINDMMFDDTELMNSFLGYYNSREKLWAKYDNKNGLLVIRIGTNGKASDYRVYIKNKIYEKCLVFEYEKVNTIILDGNDNIDECFNEIKKNIKIVLQHY